MAKVELTALTKTYPPSDKKPEFTAVNRVNLSIRDGEFMVLVGPSGCGKSTTLRMIAGLDEETSGEIKIGERVINGVSPKDRDIAMVFQNYALYPHMDVRANMGFGLKLRKVPKDQIEQRILAVAQMLGLESMLDRKPKALSGGQRQRVAVGRAIVRAPKVFLFDEPLSNLDAKMRVSMRTEISKLHARLKATMIYVTHDQVEAMTMGDRICVMRDGLVMQVATPLELYNSPANLFVGGFIGSPPMNFIHGEIEMPDDGPPTFVAAGGDIRCPITGALADRARERRGTAVVLGIRSEDITVAEPGQHGFPFTIELAEPMGAETHLHLRAGNHTLIARVPPDATHEEAQEIHLGFDPAKLHLFDAKTEERLTP